MAKQITEPNFTQIPNAFLDSMFSFTEPEFKILMAICRQTFGWHRNETGAVISISFFCKATGLSNVTVVKCCAALIEKGLVEKTPTKQFGCANSFKLVVSDLLTPLTSKAPSLLTALTPPINQINSQPVNAVNTNKETTKTKKKKTAFDLFTEKWAAAYKEDFDGRKFVLSKPSESAFRYDALRRGGLDDSEILAVARLAWKRIKVKYSKCGKSSDIEHFCKEFMAIRDEVEGDQQPERKSIAHTHGNY